MPRGTFILEKGKCTRSNIYVATGPLLPKAIRLYMDSPILEVVSV